MFIKTKILRIVGYKLEFKISPYKLEFFVLVSGIHNQTFISLSYDCEAWFIKSISNNPLELRESYFWITCFKSVSS